MDFQRFALVRVGAIPGEPDAPRRGGPRDRPAAAGSVLPRLPAQFTQPLPGTTSPQLHCWDPPGGDGEPAVPGGGTAPALTALGGAWWDTRWGTCIGPYAGENPATPGGWCGKNNPDLPGSTAVVAAGQTKTVEANFGAEPTQQVIALDAVRDIPNITTGNYMLVSWVNPFGDSHKRRRRPLQCRRCACRPWRRQQLLASAWRSCRPPSSRRRARGRRAPTRHRRPPRSRARAAARAAGPCRASRGRGPSPTCAARCAGRSGGCRVVACGSRAGSPRVPALDLHDPLPQGVHVLPRQGLHPDPPRRGRGHLALPHRRAPHAPTATPPASGAGTAPAAPSG